MINYILLFIFLQFNNVKSNDITKVEYQHPINNSYFKDNYSIASYELFDWIDNNLEDKILFDEFKIKKQSIQSYFRKVIIYKFKNYPDSLIKYREYVDNIKNNDLVWKIDNFDNLPYLNDSYKIEKNIYCNKDPKLSYSYFKDIDSNLDIFNTTSEIINYFPKIYNFYGNDELLYKIKYEWISDVDVEYDRTLGKITLQISLNNSNNIPEEIELSYKAKKKDSDNWSKTINIIDQIYDEMEKSKWIDKDICLDNKLENINNEENGLHSGIIFLIVIISIVLIISLIFFLLSLFKLKIFFEDISK